MSWLFPGGTTIVGSPVTIGTTSALPPGSNASVTNTGTAYAPVLNFGIPTIANVEGTITGAASTVVTSNLAPNIVVVTQAGGKVANSTVTVTELGYLGGATSNVQAQLNTKQSTLTGAATTVTTANLAPNIVVVTNAAGKLSNNAVTTTELGYLGGVTSGIQAQLNTKRYMYPAVVDIAAVTDFPAAVANVITLPDNTSYRIVGNVDLLGARLVTGNNSSIVGQVPYYSSLRSTGIANASPMITAASGFQIDNLNLIAPTIFSCYGNAATSLYSFWRSTFSASQQIGNINGASMVSLNTCTSTPSGNVSFQGNISGVMIQSCTMKGLGGNTAAMFYLDPTLVMTGRMRFFMNNFDPGNGGTGIVVSNTANIVQSEGLWVDSNAFEDGISEAVSGIDVTTSNKIIAFNNVNLVSSIAAGQTYLTAPNVIAIANTVSYFKMTGVYSTGQNTTKFTENGTGRLQYVGALSIRVKIAASVTFVTGKANDVCSFGIYDSTRGNIAAESIQTMTAGSTTQPQNVGLLYIASMTPNSYVEVWGRNQSTAGTINIQNVIVTAVGS